MPEPAVEQYAASSRRLDLALPSMRLGQRVGCQHCVRSLWVLVLRGRWRVSGTPISAAWQGGPWGCSCVERRPGVGLTLPGRTIVAPFASVKSVSMKNACMSVMIAAPPAGASSPANGPPGPRSFDNIGDLYSH